ASMIARNGFGAAAGRAATLLALALGPAAVGAGCGAPAAPHGAPVLLKVYWEPWDVGHTMAPILVWSNDPAAMTTSPVPPGPRRVDFVFDKVLDGSKIEATDGGVQYPLEDPPIKVRLADGDAAIPAPYQMAVWYNSIPLTTNTASEAAGTSYV